MYQIIVSFNKALYQGNVNSYNCMLIVSQSVTTPTDVTLDATATYSQLQAVKKVNFESVYTQY